MEQFIVGATYSTRSICNSDVVYRFKIERRTAKSVWVKVDGQVVRRAIELYDGKETFYPFGKYSMAAIIKAGVPTYWSQTLGQYVTVPE